MSLSIQRWANVSLTVSMVCWASLMTSSPLTIDPFTFKSQSAKAIALGNDVSSRAVNGLARSGW